MIKILIQFYLYFQKNGIYYFCKAKIDRALDANKLKSLCESKNIFGEYLQ